MFTTVTRRLRLGEVQPGEPGAGGAGGRAPGPRARPPPRTRTTTRSTRPPSPPAGASPAGWRRSAAWCRWTRRPIGRTPRSNLATYTGLFDHVRRLFAATPDAREAALRRGPVLVQRGEGTLRDLRGRGVRDGGAALPPQRLRPLPHLPRRALQREDAGDPLPGRNIAEVLGMTVDAACGVLRRRGRRAPLAARAARGGAGLPPARPARHGAFRRRGAADQARHRAAARAARPFAVRAGRAHHRPAPLRRGEAGGAAARAGGRRQHRRRGGARHARDRRRATG